MLITGAYNSKLLLAFKWAEKSQSFENRDKNSPP